MKCLQFILKLFISSLLNIGPKHQLKQPNSETIVKEIFGLGQLGKVSVEYLSSISFTNQ